MRPLSEATARITKEKFSKKYISLGRVLDQWGEIVGQEFSAIAYPVKLNYRKSKNAKGTLASLDIATSSANATTLHYQKGVILERINRIFGNDWITDIRFVTAEFENKPISYKKDIFSLTEDEKKYLSDVLEGIQDDAIKQRLENLGRAILTRAKT